MQQATGLTDVAARVGGRQKVEGTLHSENVWSDGIGVIYQNDRNRELFRRLRVPSEDFESETRDVDGTRIVLRTLTK